MNYKGYIYFIQCGELFKVGATVDVYRRLHNIQTCNPMPVELFHKIKSDNMRLTEKLFQDRFGRIQRCGEWFELTPADLKYIKAGKYSQEIIESIGAANDLLTMPDLIAM